MTTEVYIQSIDKNLLEYVISNYEKELENVIFGKFGKKERYKNIDKVFANITFKLANIQDKFEESDFFDICVESKINYNLGLDLKNSKDIAKWIGTIKDKILSHVTHKNLLENNKRQDLRKMDEVRGIKTMSDILPSTHGSSMFQRGETQAINITTFASSGEYLLIDGMEEFVKERSHYLHHYNFPPYSVGETGRIGFTSRRETGHGALAQKAIEPTLPSISLFPYTIRTVTECLGSNGSTSMAATCSSTMSLMDAGVPIKDMISGIAMGVAINPKTKKHVILTDIAAWEDHYADMDFKVTGNKCGITAIQLDNKVGGLTIDVLKDALDQADFGRIFILDEMKKTINKPRDDIKKHAPRMKVLIVPEDKMRTVIGSGGATINGFESDFGVKVDLENETGVCTIFGTNRDAVDVCYNKIAGMIKDYKAGDIVTGTVFRIENYGAFVRFDESGKESMLHISNLSEGRVEKVEDVVKMGDVIKVKIDSINNKGQLELKFIEVLK